MDQRLMLEALKTDEPEVVQALQAAMALCLTEEHYAALKAVLQTVLSLKEKTMVKREMARNMLLLRTGVAGGPVHQLRHIPDVMIHLLCAIAEVQCFSSARPEWIEAMRQREEDRSNPGGYDRVGG